MKALFHMLTTLLVIPAAVLLTAAPAMAVGPGWQDVPGDLKNAAGVESNFIWNRA